MNTEIQGKSPRLLSLDVLRGGTIAAMILVNDPGDWDHIYPFLDHAQWNGCTPTDLVFPFFLFMVGVSIVYAMERRREAVHDHNKLIGHAFQRMLTLLLINYGIEFIFSFISNKFQLLTTLSNMRIPGVLPRIAIDYFICTLLYLKTSAKTRAWIFGCILVGYYLAMNFIPVPGVGYANLNPDTNLGAWLDRLVFGTSHMWNQSRLWDPEGILSTIPSIATVLFGIRVGTWLKNKTTEDGNKVTWMFVYGIGAILLGLFFDLFFPINKKLWTSSFVLYTGGLATCALAMLYWLVDVKRYKRATPFFVAFGINAITAYILAGVVPACLGYIPIYFKGQKTDPLNYIFLTVFAPNFSPVNASLCSAILLVIIIWAMVWILYKRKIIIKV